MLFTSNYYLPNHYQDGYSVAKQPASKTNIHVLKKCKPKLKTQTLKFKTIFLRTQDGKIFNNFLNLKSTTHTLENDSNAEILKLLQKFSGNNLPELWHLKNYDKPVWKHVDYIENRKGSSNCKKWVENENRGYAKTDKISEASILANGLYQEGKERLYWQNRDFLRGQCQYYHSKKFWSKLPVKLNRKSNSELKSMFVSWNYPNSDKGKSNKKPFYEDHTGSRRCFLNTSFFYILPDMNKEGDLQKKDKFLTEKLETTPFNKMPNCGPLVDNYRFGHLTKLPFDPWRLKKFKSRTYSVMGMVDKNVSFRGRKLRNQQNTVYQQGLVIDEELLKNVVIEEIREDKFGVRMVLRLKEIVSFEIENMPNRLVLYTKRLIKVDGCDARVIGKHEVDGEGKLMEISSRKYFYDDPKPGMYDIPANHLYFKSLKVRRKQKTKCKQFDRREKYMQGLV